MLSKIKLQQLIEELEVVDMKIQKERNLLDNLETIKRNLEIEFENGLYADFTDEELFKSVL